MQWKNKIWQLAAVVMVLLFILNPELAPLGLFIDAVGLELFLMMLEVQLLAILATFFGSWFRPLIPIYRRLTTVLLFSDFRQTAMYTVFQLPSPANLMHALVISSAICIVMLSYP